MIRKTKIVCTLGPACDDAHILRGLIAGGMDCARMNFSHGSHEEHLKRLNLFRSICREMNTPLPVLLDTKGPEIRCGHFPKPVKLAEGQEYTIRHTDVPGDASQLSVSYKDLHKDVGAGHHILIDDGLVSLLVESVQPNGDIVCTVENGGQVSSKKSINVPGVPIRLPFLSKRDEADILFAIEHDYDFLALSFTRDASDVLAVRRILEQNGSEHIKLIAKIENQQGIDNLDEIIRESDGIMVARGDLGVEIPVEHVPVVQKLIIKKCLDAYKVVITATQMLDSMIRNPRPTRAEASDVANAIFDGTSCIMLSGETAGGKYPLEALHTMASIAVDSESVVHYWKRMHSTEFVDATITDAISHSTCMTAMSLNAKAIITFTKTGITACSISRFHPQCPVICATMDERVERQMRLYWGVYPYYVKEVSSTDELFELAMKTALDSGLAQDGDLVVITAGVPVGVSGTTNMIKAQMLGNILCSGRGVCPGTVSGKVCLVSPANMPSAMQCRDAVIVARDADETVLPLLRQARALVTESDGNAKNAAAAGLALGIPVIVQVGGAMRLLKHADTVTVDGGRGIVKPG